MSCNDKHCKNSCNSLPNANNYGNPLAELFSSLPPKQFALLSAIIGVLLIDNLNIDQQNALGNFFLNVGQTILTSAAQSQSLQGNNFQDNSLRLKIEMLKQQLSDLEQELGF